MSRAFGVLALDATDPAVVGSWTAATRCGVASELPRAAEGDGTTTSRLAVDVRRGKAR